MPEKFDAVAPAVSVVIPAFNYARYLPLAIDSALNQTHANLEVIVVDDGSTDDTREVVGAYRDERVRYVHQENAGLSAARNTGIRNARFAFVGFLDADDEWLPDMLAAAMERFANLPERFAIIACGSFRVDLQ